MTRTIGSAWFLGVLLTAMPLFATDAAEPVAEPLPSHATPAAADETANTSSPAGTVGEAESEAEPADALGQDATTEGADDDTQVNEDEPLTEQEQQAADEERQAQRRARQRAVAAAYRNPHAPGGWLRQGWTHFFAAEAGAARINRQAVWTGRLMLGPAFRREPSYFALPLMVDLTEGEGVAVGAGVDILSQKAGTFLTLGGLVDPDASGIFTASLGWQLFVVDLQVTARESSRNSQVFFKLRLPISTLIRAVTDQ